MKTKIQSATANTITSLPPSPDEERHGRMIRYCLAMLVRLVCIIVAFLVPGWWALVPAIGAVVLPYIAVVLANVGHEGIRGEVTRPGGVELYRPSAQSGYVPPNATFSAPAGGWSGAADASSAAGASGSTTYAAPAPGSNGESRPDQR